MKHILIVALFAASGAVLHAQNTSEWSVIATQGGTDRNGTVQLEWTLGESATATGTYTSGTLAEGFQQPVLAVERVQTYVRTQKSSGDEAGSSAHAIELFPNPTAGKLHVAVNEEPGAMVRISLMDITGQLLSEQRALLPASLDLDLQAYPTGTYLLRIHSSSGTFNEVYRIIRQH